MLKNYCYWIKCVVTVDVRKPFPNTDLVTSFSEQELQNMAEALPQRTSNLLPLFLVPPFPYLPSQLN